MENIYKLAEKIDRFQSYYDYEYTGKNEHEIDIYKYLEHYIEYYTEVLYEQADELEQEMVDLLKEIIQELQELKQG